MDTEIAVPISLSAIISIQRRIRKTLGVTIPLATFLARAIDIANDDLPLSKPSRQSADVLFDEILGLRDVISYPLTSRGNFIPQINTALIPEQNATGPVKRNLKEVDIIDILCGKVSIYKPSRNQILEPVSDTTTEDFSMNVFSIKVPFGDEYRGKVFLERIKALLQDEPEKLIF